MLSSTSVSPCTFLRKKHYQTSDQKWNQKSPDIIQIKYFLSKIKNQKITWKNHKYKIEFETQKDWFHGWFGLERWYINEMSQDQNQIKIWFNHLIERINCSRKFGKKISKISNKKFQKNFRTKKIWNTHA